jgi:hypothetical protein
MMNARCPFLGITATVLLVAMTGCKPGREKAGGSGQVGAVSPSEIAVVKEGMTRGMREIAPDNLGAGQVGRQCVVIARTADERNRAGAAPPPLGMVRKFGPVTAYKGEIVDVSPAGLRIRAPYPTSGQYKFIEISRGDIQSVHLAQ